MATLGRPAAPEDTLGVPPPPAPPLSAGGGGEGSGDFDPWRSQGGFWRIAGRLRERVVFIQGVPCAGRADGATENMVVARLGALAAHSGGGEVPFGWVKELSEMLSTPGQAAAENGGDPASPSSQHSPTGRAQQGAAASDPAGAAGPQKPRAVLPATDVTVAEAVVYYDPAGRSSHREADAERAQGSAPVAAAVVAAAVRVTAGRFVSPRPGTQLAAGCVAVQGLELLLRPLGRGSPGGCELLAAAAAAAAADPPAPAAAQAVSQRLRAAGYARVAREGLLEISFRPDGGPPPTQTPPAAPHQQQPPSKPQQQPQPFEVTVRNRELRLDLTPESTAALSALAAQVVPQPPPEPEHVVALHAEGAAGASSAAPGAGRRPPRSSPRAAAARLNSAGGSSGGGSPEERSCSPLPAGAGVWDANGGSRAGSPAPRSRLSGGRADGTSVTSGWGSPLGPGPESPKGGLSAALRGQMMQAESGQSSRSDQQQQAVQRQQVQKRPQQGADGSVLSRVTEHAFAGPAAAGGADLRQLPPAMAAAAPSHMTPRAPGDQLFTSSPPVDVPAAGASPGGRGFGAAGARNGAHPSGQRKPTARNPAVIEDFFHRSADASADLIPDDDDNGDWVGVEVWQASAPAATGRSSMSRVAGISGQSGGEPGKARALVRSAFAPLSCARRVRGDIWNQAICCSRLSVSLSSHPRALIVPFLLSPLKRRTRSPGHDGSTQAGASLTSTSPI